MNRNERKINIAQRDIDYFTKLASEPNVSGGNRKYYQKIVKSSQHDKDMAILRERTVKNI